jgi:hypothetical protein
LKKASIKVRTANADKLQESYIFQEMLFRLYIQYQTDLTIRRNKFIVDQKDQQIVQLKSIRPKMRRFRPKFPQGYFIYIALTKIFLFEKEAKLGLTDNLKTLFTSYNRLTKTVLVYYRDCGSETNMNSCEATIFNHLKNYRRYQNGEKFLLKDKDLSFFINTIDNVIDFVTAIPGKGIQHLDMIAELESEDNFEFETEEPEKTLINKNFIKQVDKRVQELEIENSELKARSADLELENSELKARSADLELENSNLKTRLAELELKH